MSAIRCIVFDLDDTLCLERDYARSGFLAVGRWAADVLGIPDVAARAWAELESGRRGDIFDRVLAASGRPSDRNVVKAMVSVYRNHVPSLSLLEDARACLTRLSGKAVLACITDGPVASQRAKAQALHLARWFDPIVFTDTLGPGFGKPHPRAFQMIEAATGSSGRACAYIADNPTKDFGAPASLGWRTVRVVRPGGFHSTLPSGGDVEVELSDLSSLPETLGIPA